MYSSKILLTLACYTFSDGPWRDTLCRFGYDPRKDPEARLFVYFLVRFIVTHHTIWVIHSHQRIYFRNVNHPVVRASVLTRRQESRSAIIESQTEKRTSGDEGSNATSHIFDGMHPSRESATFQLCDITDPMLKEMIEDEDAVRDECNVRVSRYIHITLV